MEANQQLAWREIDDRHVEVSSPVDLKRINAMLEFDASGDIVRCSADARPRDVGGALVPARWGGEVSDYWTLGGIRMPTRAAVYWDLSEGRFTYWRAQVTSAEALTEPFAL